MLSLCKASAFSLLIILSVILMPFRVRFISVENNVLFMYVTGLFLLGAACVNKKKNEKDPIIFLSSSSALLLSGSTLLHCSLCVRIVLVQASNLLRCPHPGSRAYFKRPSQSELRVLSEFRIVVYFILATQRPSGCFWLYKFPCLQCVILSFDCQNEKAGEQQTRVTNRHTVNPHWRRESKEGLTLNSND